MLATGGFAVAPAEAAENAGEDLYEKLQALDCLWDMNKYEPEKNVTRGEFASLLNKLSRGGYQNQNNTSDMTEGEDRYFEQVQKAVENDLMHIYDDGSFAPDKNIRLDDVCYAFVNILGYGKTAKAREGYPKGYEAVASDIKLLDGVGGAYSNYVSQETMLKIIDNALECDMMVLKFNGGNPELTVEEDRNLLGMIFSIYKYKGRITANEYGSLLDNNSAGMGKFKIGDKTMYVGETDAALLLGYEAEVYYRENDDEYEALWLEVKEKEEVFILAEDLIDFNNRVLEYEDNNRAKKATISQKAKIIYNGAAISEYTRDDIMIETGDITLLREDNSSSYDIVIIQSYENYVVDTVDSENNTIYAKLSKKLTWDDSAKVLVYQKNYKEIGIGDIVANSVVSAAISKDGALVTLMVTNETIEGTIGEVTKEDGKIYAVIGEREYSFDKAYYTDDKLVKTDVSGSFYLDIDGKIAYVDAQSFGNWAGAYIIKCYEDENNDFCVRYFGGEVKEAKLSDTFKLDGIRYKATDAPGQMSSGKFALIKMNGSGLITAIDYPSSGLPEKSESENSLRLMRTITSKTYYRPNTVSFDKCFLMNEDTQVFVLPKDKENYSEYQLTDISKFSGKTYNGISAYCVGSNAEYAEYVVYDMEKDTYQFTNEAAFYLVKGIKQTIDEDDNAVNLVKYYTTAGALEESVVSEEVDNISEIESGDIVKLCFDDKGRISLMNKVFDYSEKKMDEDASNDRIFAYYTHAYRRMNKTLFLSKGNDATLTDVYQLDTVPAKCSVFVFDTNKKTLSQGSVYDIIDWERSHDSYTEFFIRFYYNDPQVIFIWE